MSRADRPAIGAESSDPVRDRVSAVGQSRSTRAPDGSPQHPSVAGGTQEGSVPRGSARVDDRPGDGASADGPQTDGVADDSARDGGAPADSAPADSAAGGTSDGGAPADGAGGGTSDGGAAPADSAAGSTSDDRGPATDDRSRPTLIDQIGGPMGMLDSGLPVVVFIVVNIVAGLTAGIVAALSAGVLIAIMRLVRHKPVSQAIGGLFAVGIAAYIAHRVGSARGYFLFGIWTYLAYGGAFLLSMIIRWPLIGVVWEGLNGRGMAWRADRRLRHRYDAATLVWVLVFAARYAVQQSLYGSNEVAWLGAARIAMGYPLFIVAIGVTILIVGSATGVRLRDVLRRRSGNPAVTRPDPESERAADALGQVPAPGQESGQRSVGAKRHTTSSDEQSAAPRQIDTAD